MATLTLIDPLVIAEDAWSYSRPWPNQVRQDQGDLVLWNGAVAHRQDANVLRVRLDPGSVDRRIDQAREWMAAHGGDEFTCCVGPSTTPTDLVDRLMARGAVPDPEEPVWTPMVLDHEPPSGPAGLDVRPVRTLEEYGRCREIAGEGYEMTAEDRAAARERLAKEWEYAQVDGNRRFLVHDGGEPVAYAILMRLLVGPPGLAGAVVHPKARGRGIYRGLLRARWDAAVESGATSVVALAAKKERPVLEHFGLRAGPSVHLLVDHSGFKS